jgi:8-oxo-dGTP diphosphatase
MKFTDYVLTFVLSPDYQKILLILKKKPEFQRGKFNGIGGKVEVDDKSLEAAASRELKEETGLDLPEYLFHKFCVFTDKKQDDTTHRIFCYALTADIDKINTVNFSPTEEQVFLIQIENLRWLLNQGRLLSNVVWLTEMAVNKLKHKKETYMVEVI